MGLFRLILFTQTLPHHSHSFISSLHFFLRFFLFFFRYFIFQFFFAFFSFSFPFCSPLKCMLIYVVFCSTLISFLFLFIFLSFVTRCSDHFNVRFYFFRSLNERSRVKVIITLVKANIMLKRIGPNNFNFLLFCLLSLFTVSFLGLTETQTLILASISTVLPLMSCVLVLFAAR